MKILICNHIFQQIYNVFVGVLYCQNRPWTPYFTIKISGYGPERMWTRSVREIMTLYFYDEGHRNCSGHKGWCESVFS